MLEYLETLGLCRLAIVRLIEKSSYVVRFGLEDCVKHSVDVLVEFAVWKEWLEIELNTVLVAQLRWGEFSMWACRVELEEVFEKMPIWAAVVSSCNDEFIGPDPLLDVIAVPLLDAVSELKTHMRISATSSFVKPLPITVDACKVFDRIPGRDSTKASTVEWEGQSAGVVIDAFMAKFGISFCNVELLIKTGVSGDAALSTVVAKTCEFSQALLVLLQMGHAEKHGLNVAVEIRLRSTFTGNDDYMLGFFLPVICQGSLEQLSDADAGAGNVSEELQALLAMRYLHKPRDLKSYATTRFTHAGIWSGNDGWKLEFCGKWDWHVFNKLHTECQDRNTQEVSVKVKDLRVSDAVADVLVEPILDFMPSLRSVSFADIGTRWGMEDVSTFASMIFSICWLSVPVSHAFCILWGIIGWPWWYGCNILHQKACS